jgi:branched-chain amino acid transport system substrate-binding protein
MPLSIPQTRIWLTPCDQFAFLNPLLYLFYKPKGHNKTMENKNNSVWWVIGIIVVIGLVWWGVSQNNTASGSTIKIGFIGPLTGDGAVYGEPFEKTVQMAVEQLNAASGIDGKQVEVIYEDGKCAGQDATNAAQKLVNVDGVQAIIGGFCSGETIPVVPVAAAGKVVVLSPGASSPKLTGISPYFFRDYPSDASQATIYGDLAYNKKGWKTIGVMEEQTDYATALNDAFSKSFEGHGGKIIVQAFPSTATDFRSFLTTLKSQKPDALFVDTQTPAVSARIFDQLAQLGWKPALLIDDATAGDPATIKKYSKQLEGAITAEFLPNASDTQYMAFIQAYQKKYGQVPPFQNYMATVYDAVNLLAVGIKQVGYNGEALATWSRTISNWRGASGNVTIGQDGDRVGGHIPEMIHNGEKQALSL